MCVKVYKYKEVSFDRSSCVFGSFFWSFSLLRFLGNVLTLSED